MIYLASPYSHRNPAIRQQRFEGACRATAALIQAGHAVFSPVVFGHALVEQGLPTEWDFWQGQDQAMLRRCDEIVVLMLPGWQVSLGVAAEVSLARALGKPCWFVEPRLLDGPGTPTLAHVATGVER